LVPEGSIPEEASIVAAFGSSGLVAHLRSLETYYTPFSIVTVCTEWEFGGTGLGVPHLELEGGETVMATTVELFPKLVFSPERWRDCTRIPVNPWRSEVTFGIKVLDSAGRPVPVVLLDAGAWTDRVDARDGTVWVRALIRP